MAYASYDGALLAGICDFYEYVLATCRVEWAGSLISFAPLGTLPGTEYRKPYCSTCTIG